MKTVILAVLVLMISGCAPIQETYKPLYQAEPVKEPIEADKK